MRRFVGAALAVLSLLAALLLLAAPALADNTVQGYEVHWLGTGDYIAVCPQGDTMQYHNIPGKAVAPGVPAQQVTCYLPSGNVDPTAAWEGQGVPVGQSGRLYPPQSAVGQAPWIANLANLGVVTGIPGPLTLVGDAINHWIATSLSNLDGGVTGFFNTLDNMPLLYRTPLVRQGFAASLLLVILVTGIRVVMDLGKQARGTATVDWRRYGLLGAVAIGAPVAMDAASLVTNGAVDGLWKTVLHVPAAPSGLALMQMVGGGSGTSLFPSGGALSFIGGILFLLLAALLLLAIGFLIAAVLLVWLALGAFAPLLALWGTWDGGVGSPRFESLKTVWGRTLAFHTALAVFWLFLYGAMSGVDQALGLGGKYIILLLLVLVIAGSLFYWVVPLARALVGGETGQSAAEQWADQAAKLLTRVSVETGNPHLAEMGATLREDVRGRMGRARTVAKALPDLQHDRFSLSLETLGVGNRVAAYEKAASDPASLVHWEPYTTDAGDRYVVLTGRATAVEYAQKALSHMPIQGVTLETLPDGRMAARASQGAKVAAALPVVMADAVPYWHSPLGWVTMRDGLLVKLSEAPERGISMGEWGR